MPDEKLEDGLLAISLSCAVPLSIMELQWKGGPDDTDLEHTREFAWVLGSEGDSLLYRSKEKGQTAKVFAGLARALAVLSFCPGGIKFLGSKWETITPVPMPSKEELGW